MKKTSRLIYFRFPHITLQNNLKNEIFKFTNENSFIKSKSMGELMEQTLEYLKRNYQNVSLIDLI